MRDLVLWQGWRRIRSQGSILGMGMDGQDGYGEKMSGMSGMGDEGKRGQLPGATYNRKQEQSPVAKYNRKQEQRPVVKYNRKQEQSSIAEYYEKMRELGCFTLQDVTEMVGERSAVTYLVNDYQRRGYIERIHRNLYTVINRETEEPALTRYQIGSRLFPDAYIALHSAFGAWGYALRKRGTRSSWQLRRVSRTFATTESSTAECIQGQMPIRYGTRGAW